ncbi:hypothetical protein E4U39_005877 [Claviceps sp. Clav50 group G5]|nr:hypothetical protein E4U39_005877 [Claviceps sp. Clav50 group G5]
MNVSFASRTTPRPEVLRDSIPVHKFMTITTLLSRRICVQSSTVSLCSSYIAGVIEQAICRKKKKFDLCPPFKKFHERRGYSVEPPASKPSEPSEPVLTGKYLAVKIVDTELSTLEKAATALFVRMSRQIIDVVGQRKALLPNIKRA